MFIFGVDATWYLWLLITGIYIGPIAGHQHPTWLHHLPRSFLFFPINALFFLPRCALSDGQISPKKQTKQLFVWQLLPNDYIQSILLAPGNAKSNVKMQKKKKNQMKNHGGPCPTFQGHIKSSSKLVRPSDLLRPFCLDHSLWQDPQNIFHLPPPTLRSAQGRIGGQYLIACN